MGAELDRRGLKPDRILSSPAARALQTARQMAAAASWTTEIELDERLYHANAGAGLLILRRQPTAAGVLLVAAHEPMCSELLAVLSGESWRAFPTSGVAILDCDIDDWAELGGQSSARRLLLRPSDLGPREELERPSPFSKGAGADGAGGS
jgi:phosphohistidine phosphatase